MLNLHKFSWHFSEKNNQFKNLHTDLPDMLSKKASKYNLENFIQSS